MKLREIAHARAGDKGDVSNIAVIAYRAEDYVLLSATVTAARVREHFAGLVRGGVRRYELPGLGALNFVMDGALGGGVTRSLALDQHGKALSSSLLDMDLGQSGEPVSSSGRAGRLGKAVGRDPPVSPAVPLKRSSRAGV